MAFTEQTLSHKCIVYLCQHDQLFIHECKQQHKQIVASVCYKLSLRVSFKGSCMIENLGSGS